MSETTPAVPATLCEAIIALQTQLPRIAKTRQADVETKTGRSYKYKFADLADVSEDLLPLMAKLGMSFTSRPTLNADGKFVLAYRLWHISGEKDVGEYPISAGPPQDVGSQITYARRQCLCAVTGLAPDRDDDAALTQAARGRGRRGEGAESDGAPGVNALQQRQMQDLFRQVGADLAGKPERLAYVIDTIGRDVRSATELTRAEAGKVIAKLESWIAQNEPPAGDPQ